LGIRARDGHWRIDDPLPALAYCVDLLFRAGRRFLRRLNPSTPPLPRHRIVSWRGIASEGDSHS
jgi:hypothetical protein